MKSKLLYFFIIFSIIFSSCFVCMASDVDAIDTESEETEQTFKFISSDLYKFDTDLTISDTVDGNIFAFGENVTIDSEIGGDVFVMGTNVTFTQNAYIYGNIFAVAETLVMNGAAYDLYGVAVNLTLSETSIIARDIKTVAENTYINGSIRRNAFIYTNSLIFPEEGTGFIAGNLEYTSQNEFQIREGVVAGEIKFTEEVKKEVDTANVIVSYINDVLSAVLYSLVVVLLAVWLAPKFINKAPVILKKKPLASFGVGFLASVVGIIVPFIFLFISYGLGIGISVAAIVLYFLVLTIAKTVFGIAVAKQFSVKLKEEKFYHVVLFTLLVVLVVSLLELIPLVGGFIGFAVSMLGLGIFVLSLINKKDFEEEKVEIVEE